MPKVLGDAFDRCCQPLAGDEPMGQDPKRGEAYGQLKGEIGNIDSGTTDWKQVENLAVEILSEQGKDLNVAAYLSLALLQRHGMAGLADGVDILRHLVENHWSGLHPKSEKQRGFTFGWMSNRLPLFLENRPIDAAEVPLLEPLLEGVQAVEASARQQAKKIHPSLGDLKTVLAQKASAHRKPEPSSGSTDEPGKAESQTAEARTVESSAPQPTPAPQREPPDPAPPTDPDPATPGVSTAGTTNLPPQEPLAPDASHNEVRNRLRSLIAPLRQSNPVSLLSYRLLRSLKWDDLSDPPAADAGSGKTMIDSPRAQRRTALETLHQNGKWSTLLEVSEADFQDAKGTFWLDLQFYTAAALEGLDAEKGARAAALVQEELRKLLERFPGLPGLKFRDDSPFASQQTRQWIEESVVKMELDVVGATVGRLDEVVLSDEDLAQAKALFKGKKPVQALELMQAGVRKASNRRSAFQARLVCAQLCLEANHLDWAKGLLEDLGKELENFSFEAWEPETAAQIYHLLALCYGRLLKAKKSPEAKEALAEAMAEIQVRLVRLDLPSLAKIDEVLGLKEETSKGGLGRLFGLS